MAIRIERRKKHADIMIAKSDKIYYAIVNFILTIFFIIVLLPLINVVASSFSSPTAVNTGKVLLWPVEFNLRGYKAVFEYQGVWTAYLNTFYYTIVGTFINIALTMCAAYPLTRRELPFRNFFTSLFMFTMLFSGGIIPGYMLIKSLNMLDTRWAMIVPGAISIYNMIIARTFIANIPDEMVDASKIDGCSDYRYFFSIVLPLSKTVIAVLSLYYAVGHWNDYMTAFLYLNSDQLMPLQIILRTILVMNQVDPDVIMDEESMMKLQGMADLLKYALIIVSSIPVLVIYPFVKKYFMKGIMIGSVKG